jgi:hypothetical protein
MTGRIAIVSAAMVLFVGAPVVMAQDKCPVELRDAKAKLAAVAKVPRAPAGFQGGSSEAPRAAAGFQGGSSEAPRAAAGFQGGSSEAPRAAAGFQGGSSEAPRAAAGFQGGSSEAPRAAAGFQGGSSEAPRAAAGAKAPDNGALAQARKLIAEAEAACKKGDMAASSQKAKAALEALK